MSAGGDGCDDRLMTTLPDNSPDDPQPWTVRSSRVVVRDRWIKLRADDCVTAEGAEVAPYCVEYPSMGGAIDDEGSCDHDEIGAMQAGCPGARSLDGLGLAGDQLRASGLCGARSTSFSENSVAVGNDRGRRRAHRLAQIALVEMRPQLSLAYGDTTKTKRPGAELALVGPDLASSATSRRTAWGIGRSCHQRWVRASRKSWSRTASGRAGNGRSPKKKRGSCRAALRSLKPQAGIKRRR